MTNSNLDSKKPIKGFSKTQGLFSEIDSDLLEPFDRNIYKQTESFLDWNTEVDIESSINDFYLKDSDQDSYADTTGEPYKQAAGLGIDIGGGIALDKVTAPLLVAPVPGARPLYFGINFVGGVGLNIAAQKARGEENIDIGEAIQSGAIQMIPFGSTAKIGKGGLKKSAIQGAVTAVGGEQIRKGINEGEFLTPQEIFSSAAVGGGFGVTFKGALDGLEAIGNKLNKKYAGKTAQQINEQITEKEKKEIINAISQTNQLKKKLETQQPTSTTAQPNTVYQLPQSLLKSKPRYGRANIEFESELDLAAYLVRSGKKTRSKSYDKIIVSLQEQGFSPAEIKAHGDTLHKRVKDMVTEMTGTAQASENTRGLTLKIPTDTKYIGQSVNKKAKKVKQDLGDKTKTPQQYTNKGVPRTFQKNVDQNIREMKDRNVFEGRKSQIKTKLGALNKYDERVLDLKNTTRIKKMAEEYIKFYGERPPDELAYALAQNVVLATDEVIAANKKYANALGKRDFDAIEKAAVEIDAALQKVEEWLTLDIKAIRTPFGRVGKTLQAKPDSGLAGKTVDEVMDMTPTQKRLAAENVGESTLSIDETIEQKREFRDLLKQRIKEAKESGDLTELYKLANDIQRSEGKVENVVAYTKVKGWQKSLSKVNKVINEIGINALLSAPTTQEVNFISGVAQSYLASLKLVLGARGAKEREAALRHIIALHSNFNFARKAWKASWDIEDNFVNIGNYKGADSSRFAISSDMDNLAGRFTDNSGKVIRLPMRLMTSTDALIQAPNIIAGATFEAFNEGTNRGLQGDKLNKFIKGHVDSILQYYAENGKTPIEDISKSLPSEFQDELSQIDFDPSITGKILRQGQEFAKTITFTQDIRRDDFIGRQASNFNQFVNANPLARFYFAFTKAPTNILKSNARLLPFINEPTILGKSNLINDVLLPEIRNDLLSRDPLIAQQTRGELMLSRGLAMLIGGIAVNYRQKTNEEGYIPPIILTGGGPDFMRPEGAAMWKAQWKNGWSPYSVGRLQYNDDGEPLIGEDGEPVYEYDSYEYLPEPIAGYMRLMVDFVNASGVIGDKPYGDFTIGWMGAVGRNIFNRSFTTQINEALSLLQAVPKIGEGDTPNDSPANYKLKRLSQIAGRTIVSRLVPFSNLGSKLKQAPADILEMMGYSKEEIQQYRQKVDTKVREGDAINEKRKIEDPLFNKHNEYKRLLRDIINQSQEKFIGLNYDLPFMEEHATGEPVLYPQRRGLDLFSLQKYSRSKNLKYYSAQKLIGRLLPEPKEVIVGPYGSKDNITPKKLNTYDYNQLRRVINRVKIDGKTLIEKQNEYLEMPEYTKPAAKIKEVGLNSEEGQIAAKIIYSAMSQINRSYILKGESMYFEQKMDNEELQRRIDKKRKIKESFVNFLETN